MDSRDNNHRLVDKIHRRATELVQSEVDGAQEKQQIIQKRDRLIQLVSILLEKEDEILPCQLEEEIVQQVVNRMIGFGPLEPLLKDPEISEIMVNSPNKIFIERNGRIEPVQTNFRDEEHILNVVERIISPLGRRVDESVPIVDARLPDGSRVNAIIRPLSLRSPALTIRRFSPEPFTLRKLIELNTLTLPMAHFLQACVRSRVNVLISGGTGSGKTSTLNALAQCIPSEERLVTIEDTAELQLSASNLVSLEARPPNIEGEGEISIRTLVRNALRMRPDRIIVGEVRGPEAFDMLQAMNTGHPGSLTTIHANSPQDAIWRLESMILMTGFEIPQPAIRDQIASALDLIIQQERLPGGDRKIVSVAEVAQKQKSAKGKTEVRVEDIFRYDQFGFEESGAEQGAFKTMISEPSCLKRIRRSGNLIQDELI